MNVNILLIDSVSSYREEVAQQLEQLGYHTVEAENGAQALAAFVKSPFDMVVMDNDLPDQSGMDLTSALRDVDKKIKVLLIVDPIFSEEENRSVNRTGVCKFVRGPISPGHLVQQVLGFLSNGGSAKSQTTPSESPSSSGEYIGLRTNVIHGDRTLEAHIKEVRRDYQEKLPGELQRLQKTLIAARENPTSENLEAVHTIAHTLHGTAGTLGFDEISDLVGFIDGEIKQLIDGKLPSAEIWREIFHAFTQAETVPERLSLVISIEPHTNNIATILVADKDEQIISKIAEEAHNRCIDVRGAWTKSRAMEWAAAGKLDGAILDISFAGSEHIISFIERIKNIEQMKDVPIALMSDDCSVENRVVAAHAGATHFLTRPPPTDDLAEVVQQFIVAKEQLTYRVLVVDDDEPFREHIGAILRESGFSVTTLGEPKKIMEMAELYKPDIMLLDVMMPDISGFDVCKMLRSTTTWKDIPILFLTAEADPKIRLECFRAGGDDYIKKPVLKEELLARIDVRTERIRLYKERADKDALTSLPSRRAFIDLFKLRIAEGRRYNRPVSLCLLDIDHFKYVNDTYGHLTGDRVLASLGKLLASRFRAVDIRGRWGGEEFTVVFYNEGRDTAKLILSRLLEEFQHIEFEGDHGEKFFCTFSCGIAELPFDGRTIDDLFRIADERLYVAKESGRNRIVNEQ
jgi:diguanylate cyclase (GGDEF)-like protein